MVMRDLLLAGNPLRSSVSACNRLGLGRVELDLGLVLLRLSRFVYGLGISLVDGVDFGRFVHWNEFV